MESLEAHQPWRVCERRRGREGREEEKAREEGGKGARLRKAEERGSRRRERIEEERERIEEERERIEEERGSRRRKIEVERKGEKVREREEKTKGLSAVLQCNIQLAPLPGFTHLHILIACSIPKHLAYCTASDRWGTPGNGASVQLHAFTLNFELMYPGVGGASGWSTPTFLYSCGAISAASSSSETSPSSSSKSSSSFFSFLPCERREKREEGDRGKGRRGGRNEGGSH